MTYRERLDSATFIVSASISLYLKWYEGVYPKIYVGTRIRVSATNVVM